MNLKNKETQLFETLNKLDSIADLIKNSKEESSYLRKLSSQLEKEKEELNQKSKNLELEKNSIIDELKVFEQKGGKTIHVSLSHIKEHAVAFVIIEK